VALQQAVEKAPDRLLLADVEALVLEGAGQRCRQLRGLRQRLLAAAAGDDGGAEAGQFQGGLAPEAAAGAGDGADLPLEQPVPEDPRTVAFSHRRRSLSAGRAA